MFNLSQIIIQWWKYSDMRLQLQENRLTFSGFLIFGQEFPSNSSGITEIYSKLFKDDTQ